MIIDCDMCDMQATRACDDCIVTALLGDNGVLELAEDEQSAISELSKVGLVAPLRLQPRDSRKHA